MRQVDKETLTPEKAEDIFVDRLAEIIFNQLQSREQSQKQRSSASPLE